MLSYQSFLKTRYWVHYEIKKTDHVASLNESLEFT